MSSAKKQSSLDNVQNLYLMQVELWNFLDAEQSDAQMVKSAQKTLKEFKTLLKEVDWQMMGGEDVLQSLQMIPLEVHEKLKKATPRKALARRSVARKPSARKAAGRK